MTAAGIRPPAVAGLFYPASPSVLRSTVEELLRAVPTSPSARPPKALLAPHAGYRYSGPIAASAFAPLRDAAALRVVLLGPSHRVPFTGLALPGATAFATPLGEVAVDAELAAAVGALPQVLTLPEAHAEEHALEVELPFLQLLLPRFTLLPLVVGEAEPDTVANVLERVWGGPETLVVVSSDLSHYLHRDAARRMDRDTIERVLRLDGPLSPQQACGARPLSGLLVAARRHDLVADLLDLRNSADTAGDPQRVVGYAAVAFREPARAPA
ncbi:MAG TPA: AmmeMemoRadiSam system protein B [Thermoanaerobaculia bacterium]